MRLESVEIYSDATNAAVMRHPDRRFPGILVQGDTLWTMCRKVDQACSNNRSVVSDAAYMELNDLRNQLWELLAHYKSVLAEHGMPLPFYEIPPIQPLAS